MKEITNIKRFGNFKPILFLGTIFLLPLLFLSKSYLDMSIVAVEVDYSYFPEENPKVMISPIGDVKDMNLKLSIKKQSQLVYYKELQTIPSHVFDIRPDLMEGGVYDLFIDVQSKERSEIRQTFHEVILAGKQPIIKHLIYVRGKKFDQITKYEVSVLNNSPYNGFAVQPVGAYDTFLPKYEDFLDKVKLIKENINQGKSIWPWVFFNRIIGCSGKKQCEVEYFKKIKGMDIYDETGALGHFLEIFKLSLRLAKETGAPGIIFDHEAYNYARAYSISYLSKTLNKSPEEIKQKLKEIGYKIADYIHEIYPEAILLSLVYKPYHPRRQDSPGYVIDGILERAKEKKYEFKVVDGGEGSIGPTNFSVDDLRDKIIKRATYFNPYLQSYPNLYLGGTIAPYEDIEKTTGLRKEWYSRNRDKIKVRTLEDFIPLFRLLFLTNEYIWIYGAGSSGPNGGYDEYNPSIAEKYDNAIRKALAPSQPKN